MPHETLHPPRLPNEQHATRKEKNERLDPHPYPHMSNAGLPREPEPVGSLSSKGQGQAMLLLLYPARTQHLEGKQTSFSVVITSTCLDPDSGSDMIAYQIRLRRVPGPSCSILRCLAASHKAPSAIILRIKTASSGGKVHGSFRGSSVLQRFWVPGPWRGRVWCRCSRAEEDGRFCLTSR
jgi:hypothetical protein